MSSLRDSYDRITEPYPPSEAGDIEDLQTQIDDETAARIAQDANIIGITNDMQGEINNETAARIAADDALDVRVTDLENA
jgi:hypothetical protein